MKKAVNLVLIGVLCITLIGCGNTADSKKNNKGGSSSQSSSSDIKKEYAKIKKDFQKIKDDVSVKNVEKVTGIKPTVIKDGVEEYGELSYEYKFDYGYSYEAYIKISYSHNPKSVYSYDRTYVELKAPNELYKNDKLNMSSIKNDDFKADISRGIKVSALNSQAGGEGFANKYEQSAKTGFVDVSSMIWADKNGNIIKSSLRGDESVALADKVLSFASYQLKQ